MAKLNSSSKHYDNYLLSFPSYALIASFDKLKTEEDKLKYINEFSESEVKAFRSLAETLQERLENPPKPIPDKSIFSTDPSLLDKQGLINLVDDIRFLLAVKYRTF